MERISSQALTEDEIHALVDAQVSPRELAVLQERLARDPAAQAKVVLWQRQRSALKDLHRLVLEEPVPVPLKTAALQSSASQHQINRWWRWGGIAAGVMMTFGTGWFSHSFWQQERQGQAVTDSLAKARSVREFARQASFAHSVYSPEVRHPVEVAATEQEHLVQWLSKRVGKPLKVPNLTAQGYELVGGRLLPGEGGARAQFMFQSDGGSRITLYLGAIDKTAKATTASETGFNFSSDGPIPSFYWVEQGFGYALAGQVSREVLMKLAEAVYRQL
ncbi:MAG: anti-sigma factor family protein [Rhodoferax sp.]